MSALIRIAAFLAAAALAPAALAAEASMDKADVVWMLVSTTLVLFMTIPGIALFYPKSREIHTNPFSCL